MLIWLCLRVRKWLCVMLLMCMRFSFVLMNVGILLSVVLMMMWLVGVGFMLCGLIGVDGLMIMVGSFLLVIICLIVCFVSILLCL